MTARSAMKEIPAIAGIIEELTNLSKKGVLTGRHWVTPASDGTGLTTEKVKKTRRVKKEVLP